MPNPYIPVRSIDRIFDHDFLSALKTLSSPKDEGLETRMLGLCVNLESQFHDYSSFRYSAITIEIKPTQIRALLMRKNRLVAWNMPQMFASAGSVSMETVDEFNRIEKMNFWDNYYDLQEAHGERQNRYETPSDFMLYMTSLGIISIQRDSCIPTSELDDQHHISNLLTIYIDRATSAHKRMEQSTLISKSGQLTALTRYVLRAHNEVPGRFENMPLKLID